MIIMTSKINNAFKIKKNMKLSLQEELIYSLISCFSNEKGISHISRQCLMDKSGIKKADTVTKHTNHLQELGLIEKTYEHKSGKKLVTYRVINPQKDFIWVSNSIFSGNPSLAAFLIRLAELKSPFSKSINISKNQLAKQLNVGKSTLYKYLDLAQKNSSILIQGDEIILSEEIFPTFEKVSKPTPEQMKKINKILNRTEELEDVEDSSIRVKKILLSYYDPKTNTFSGLKGSVDDFLNFCLSGVPKKSKNPVEQPNIQYQF